MTAIDWAGIITATGGVLTVVGLGFKWLVSFIVKHLTIDLHPRSLYYAICRGEGQLLLLAITIPI